MCRIKWHEMKDHPKYEINRLGQIRNIKTKRLIKPVDNSHGYLVVTLEHRVNYRVHILVAQQFISNPYGKSIVNHKRGNKYDNRASQLEWVTQSENVKHAWDMGLRKRKENIYGRKRIRTF